MHPLGRSAVDLTASAPCRTLTTPLFL